MKDDVKNEGPQTHEGQERREFLKKLGVGGAVLVGGAAFGADEAAAQTSGDNTGATPFRMRTFSSDTTSDAETSNKFIIDVQDWVLDDAGLAQVNNALVAAAIDSVRRVGRATPLNTAARIRHFGQFGSFDSFGSFGSFISSF
jgi:hypothetical protein